MSEIKRIQTDVAVVGSGPAGVSCAYFAAKQGLRVLLIEKSEKLGGLSGGGMGVFAVGTPEILAMNFKLTPQEAYRSYMEDCHYMADTRIVRELMVRSHETVAWLKSLRVSFQPTPTAYYAGANFTWHKYIDEGDPTAPDFEMGVLPKILPKILAEFPAITPQLSTRARRILMKDGQVCGVLCETKDGEALQIDSPAVFLATGGFAANDDMVRELTRYTIGGNVFNFGSKTSTGDGLRMAWEVGADRDHVLVEVIPCLRPPCDGPGGVPIGVGALLRQPTMLFVNNRGQRFMNEEVMRHFAQAGNVVFRQQEHTAYAIFDEETCLHYQNTPVEFQLTGETATAKGLAEYMRQHIQQGYPDFFIAKDLSDLASQLGIDSAALRETVASYNKSCESGRDELFFKNPAYLRPVGSGKLYCARFGVGTYGSAGGIRIDHRSRVLDTTGTPIPGLYAGGFDANCILGDTFPFKYAGIGSAFSFLFGRIGGETIAVQRKGASL